MFDYAWDKQFSYSYFEIISHADASRVGIYCYYVKYIMFNGKQLKYCDLVVLCVFVLHLLFYIIPRFATSISNASNICLIN